VLLTNQAPAHDSSQNEIRLLVVADEGESAGVNVTDNFIHDSYGAGVMVFGNKHLAYNASPS
jgi:hypothetical protein